MAYSQRNPNRHVVHGVADGTINSRTNPQYHHPAQTGHHQYSELLLSGMHDSSDGSATYTLPGYVGTVGSGSDGTTYSVTTANYHQPNCGCHLEMQPPPHCKSPAMTSIQSAESGSSSGSGASSSTNPMSNSCNKDALWISQNSSASRSRSAHLVDRLKQPIAWIWSAVSLILFILCTVILTQTTWLINSDTHESLGLLKQCKTNPIAATDNSIIIQCHYYSGIPSLKLPSVSWKLSFIFYCIADCLLGLSTVLALGTSLLTMAKTRRHISFFAGYVQLFSAIMFTTAVLFYMVGLDSPIVQEVCGNSSVFHTGDCHIGWSYLLLILCSAVCFLLPVLSHYIDYSHLCANPTKKRSPREYQV